MKHTVSLLWTRLLITPILVLAACAPKVMVPPTIDLGVYEKIGVIEFSSNREGTLGQYATQNFLQAIQSSQSRVRFLEIGSKEKVLQSVGHGQLDLEALETLGKKYDVRASITGKLDVTDVKPKIRLSTILSSMGVEADVEASLTARLYSTEDGATLWTDSARAKETVAHVSVSANGPAVFDARDPDKAYGKLVHKLVDRISRDLRVRYERR